MSSNNNVLYLNTSSSLSASPRPTSSLSGTPRSAPAGMDRGGGTAVSAAAPSNIPLAASAAAVHQISSLIPAAAASAQPLPSSVRPPKITPLLPSAGLPIGNVASPMHSQFILENRGDQELKAQAPKAAPPPSSHVGPVLINDSPSALPQSQAVPSNNSLQMLFTSQSAGLPIGNVAPPMHSQFILKNGGDQELFLRKAQVQEAAPPPSSHAGPVLINDSPSALPQSQAVPSNNSLQMLFTSQTVSYVVQTVSYAINPIIPQSSSPSQSPNVLSLPPKNSPENTLSNERLASMYGLFLLPSNSPENVLSNEIWRSMPEFSLPRLVIPFESQSYECVIHPRPPVL